MEFHVSRTARDYYQFDLSLFRYTGNVIFANFHNARVFAQKMNEKRDLILLPEQAVQASHINAMGLIDEILHLMVATYRQQMRPTLFADALAAISEELGPGTVNQAVTFFADSFPPVAVYRRELGLEAYLDGATGGRGHDEVEFEELLMLWLANMNPAFAPYLELFDDSTLEKRTKYLEVVDALYRYLNGQPGFGAGGENLIDILRAPALASPHSLIGQLEYMRTRWSVYIGEQVYRLLSSLDFIAEEQKAIFAGPGPVKAIDFSDQAHEPERYSPDLEWMPRVVLLARNTYVWLDQLSKVYGREIRHLDQVPDEELDLLAKRGITGLWLIGLWERSRASQRIKQMMGNPDAVASAYSLQDYRIAADLGGPEAMADLRFRAWQRGIRMASDMVPNHMAIDSRWVIEHPDWFLSSPYSPFPSYRFQGPDLSDDERVSVYLEDHYYERTDAAVVFQRVDQRTGDVRYIYHGNDGTNMPWNDTAQLNYLQADVREAVIQTILHVARQFPIIRFDAAMTLAKRHIQRLWFPQPGSGGAIPSRSEHSLTQEQFNAAMPVEFWREVVDRVAAEAPDTLLLAEAFWLLEGYFVRTLGMHRVYNSAFMHMLRDEDNDKYRLQLKNTLEFDPEILKRYVNFMTNPDEETAIAQFGSGDKYFGVATVLATVPGLPMFGHGQFEGYAEKYGMEYRRAYRDEQPDQGLIERHMQEIVPLLHRRHLFADVQNFVLYDFVTDSGHVDENVLAYSNQVASERSLVIYHNRYGDTRGRLRMSAAALDKASGQLLQRSFGDGLQIPNHPRRFLILRDLPTGLEYIRNCAHLNSEGLFVQLGAYQKHVFLDIRETSESEWSRYAKLHDYLNGRGVPSIEDALTALFLQPLQQAFQQLVSEENLVWLISQHGEVAAPPADLPAEDVHLGMQRIQRQAVSVWEEAQRYTDEYSGAQAAAISLQDLADTLIALLNRSIACRDDWEETAEESSLEPDIYRQLWGSIFVWILTHQLGSVIQGKDATTLTRSLLDEWQLAKYIALTLQEWGIGHDEAWHSLTLVKILTSWQNWPSLVLAESEPARPMALARLLLRDADVQAYLGVNRYRDVLWYNQESFSLLLLGLDILARLQIEEEIVPVEEEIVPATPSPKMTEVDDVLEQLRIADKAAHYQVAQLMEQLRVLTESTPQVDTGHPGD